MPTLQTERLTLNYHQYGHGAKPVIMLHGNLVSAITWKKVAECLPHDKYTIYTPDTKGCGNTPETGSGHTVEDFSKDLLALVTTLGLRDFHLVGHSLGGATAIDFVLNNPDYATTLTLLDPIPADGLKLTDSDIANFADLLSDKDSFSFAMLDVMPSADQSDPFIVQILEEGFHNSKETFLENIKSIRNWNVKNRLKDINTPVHLLWGELDSWIPREPIEHMAKLFPNCKFAPIENMGHSCNIERPDYLATLFQEYWAGLE